jgi:ATP-dependent exoDNAse (exonuclease V) alpha subunit
MIEDAPRGKDTAHLELEIEEHELKVDVLLDQARELTDELLATKSDAIRRRLRDKETELEEVSDALRNLRATRDSLTSTQVAQRLTTLLEALTREPFSVKDVNAALRRSVKSIIMHPEAGSMDIIWHHADQPQEVPFYTKYYWNKFPS